MKTSKAPFLGLLVFKALHFYDTNLALLFLQYSFLLFLLK